MDGSRLKVLYISRGYTTHDHRFLSSFVGAGWAPTHLPLVDEALETRPLPDGSEAATMGAEPAVSAGAWNFRRDRLAALIARLRPGVVIAGPIQSGAFLATLARARPLVGVSWGSDLLVDAGATPFSRFVTRHTLANCDAILGDCNAVREAVGRSSRIPDDRIVTFPWGVDLRQFHPGKSSLSIRDELGWGGNEVFISTRSWEPVYAVDVLVRAFARVVQSRPGARLLLLGDGSLERDIRSLVTDLGLGKFIHMTGRVPYSLLPEYFRVADAYVSSALSDGTSVSLLEAMACGLPVVVSNSFGNLEWVEDGINGALATPGNTGSLSDAMLSLPTSSAERTRMIAVNVETARNRADWAANFPALVEMVENVVDARRHG